MANERNPVEPGESTPLSTDPQVILEAACAADEFQRKKVEGDPEMFSILDRFGKALDAANLTHTTPRIGEALTIILEAHHIFEEMARRPAA